MLRYFQVEQDNFEDFETVVDDLRFLGRWTILNDYLELFGAIIEVSVNLCCFGRKM